jgi:NADPH-dependent curcumin reductase CurA
VTARLNRRIILAERPVGVPEPRHFRRDDEPVVALRDGEFLVRNIYLSIDPAQRGWVQAGGNYSSPVPVGGVMRSLAVGIVEESRHPEMTAGESLYGWFGWQDYCVATDASVLRRVDPRQAPVSAALGVLGLTGITAFLALTELGRPAADETVLVSTAAGAIGSIVGQIARRLRCRVVGLTGSDDKVRRCVGEFGYDAAVNYRSGLAESTLRCACPAGVDVFFDNTSGAIADAVLPLMNVRGRIVQCGTVAEPVWDPAPLGPRRDRAILVKRLRHEGFIIFDHVARFAEVAARLAEWVRDGSLVYREDIEIGLDRAPAALAGLYRGTNDGKKIIELQGRGD